MKKNLLNLGIIGPLAVAPLLSLNFVEEKQAQIVITKNHNILEEHRVDAGTSGPLQTTDDEKTYLSEIFTIDFKQESINFPTFYDNLYIEVDFTGSMVDINTEKLLLDEPVQKIYFADFQNQNNWTRKIIGKKTSAKSSDYEYGQYTFIYKYDPVNKLFEYQVEMYSYAYNTRINFDNKNGHINTYGKGTNRISFKSVKMIFNNPY